MAKGYHPACRVASDKISHFVSKLHLEMPDRAKLPFTFPARKFTAVGHVKGDVWR